MMTDLKIILGAIGIFLTIIGFFVRKWISSSESRLSAAAKNIHSLEIAILKKERDIVRRLGKIETTFAENRLVCSREFASKKDLQEAFGMVRKIDDRVKRCDNCKKV